MNSQARIEHHHEIQESRAQVYAVEIANRIPLPASDFDRGVGFLVERGSFLSNQTRPRRKAA